VGKRRFGRYTVETSNEDKVLFPGAGITKGRLIDYYETVAPAMLPHLRGRPLTVERFPDGIGAEGFFQKQAAGHFPRWIQRARVDTADGPQEQAICGHRAALVYLANQACVTLHVFPSRLPRLGCPDQLVIDLDPPEDDFARVRRAARQLKGFLDELETRAFVKSTGSRGVHVVVPLDRRSPYEAVREVARELAERLAARHPRELTTAQRKARRGDRLYLDVGRNAYGQTAVAPYSVRARAGAPVATPLEWTELLEDEGLGARSFTIDELPARLERRGDPWRGIRRVRQSLPVLRSKLERCSRR